MAAFSPWHDNHTLAFSHVRAGAVVPAHCLLEAYSVLTRLPAPFRAPASTCSEYLGRQFADKVIHPPPSAVEALPDQLAHKGLSGGSIYDALVGTTAAAHGLELHTLDRRATYTYQAIGVGFVLLP